VLEGLGLIPLEILGPGLANVVSCAWPCDCTEIRTTALPVRWMRNLAPSATQIVSEEIGIPPEDIEVVHA
jgi:hypothetical protein